MATEPVSAIRVGLDVSALQRDRLTGWERFVHGLGSALAEMDPTDIAVEALRLSRPTGGRVQTLTWQLGWYGWGLRRTVRQRGTHLVHSPTYPPPALAVPTVWTIHDALILGLHREYHRRGARVWAPLARKAAHRSSMMVTTTESVMRELCELGLPQDRLRAVMPGVTAFPPPRQPPSVRRLTDATLTALPREFLLTVGTLEARKQPDVAAAAAHHLGIPIVMAGGTDAAYDHRHIGTWKHIYLAGRVDDSELAWLYANASAVVAASAYEGLDFPVIEARSLGARVVASDIPVHRELGGVDCYYFPVGDSRAAADSAANALNAPRPTRHSAADWQQCARGYLAVYREAVSV